MRCVYQCNCSSSLKSVRDTELYDWKSFGNSSKNVKIVLRMKIYTLSRPSKSNYDVNIFGSSFCHKHWNYRWTNAQLNVSLIDCKLGSMTTNRIIAVSSHSTLYKLNFNPHVNAETSRVSMQNKILNNWSPCNTSLSGKEIDSINLCC